MVLDFIIELKGDNLTMLCEGKPTSLLNGQPLLPNLISNFLS